MEALLEAVRLRLRQLRSRMRGVKKAADDTTLGASAKQTEVRQCCSKLMQAIEAQQHVRLEAVTCTQEAKLDQLQRQANRIDTEAQQLLQTEKELQHAHAMGTSERPSAGLLESMHVIPRILTGVAWVCLRSARHGCCLRTRRRRPAKVRPHALACPRNTTHTAVRLDQTRGLHSGEPGVSPAPDRC